jgi:hypothetical protein
MPIAETAHKRRNRILTSTTKNQSEMDLIWRGVRFVDCALGELEKDLFSAFARVDSMILSFFMTEKFRKICVLVEF